MSNIYIDYVSPSVNGLWEMTRDLVTLPFPQGRRTVESQAAAEMKPLIQPVSNSQVISALKSSYGGALRLAGISGALAVAFGAYGAHVFYKKEESQELKQIFATANRYHFFHTLALLGVPLTNRPSLTASLFLIGILGFSGSCYYHALSNNPAIRAVTPFGGIFLMLGWLSMLL